MKVRKLKVPSDFQQDNQGSVFNIGDILDGSVVLPASHAGKEFLHILLDDSDTSNVTKWVFVFKSRPPLTDNLRASRHKETRTRLE